MPGSRAHTATAGRRRLAIASTALLMLGSLSLVAAPAASAAGTCTASWVGGPTGDWGVGGNWSTGTVPGSPTHEAEEACFGAGITVTISSGVLSVNGFNDTGSAPGDLVVTGGSITLFGTVSTPASHIGHLTLTHDAGATTTGLLAVHTSGALDVGTLDIVDGALFPGGPVSVGAGGVTISATPGHQGAVSTGVGPLTVDGDIALIGGQLGTVGLAVVQTPGHTITMSDGAGFGSRMAGVTLTAPSGLHAGGSPIFADSTTVNSAAQLVLEPGTTVTQEGALSQLNVPGVTVSGAPVPTAVQPLLRLTGTTTVLGADLAARNLHIGNGGRLSVPAARTIDNLSAVTVEAGGLLAGAGRLTGGLDNFGVVSPGGSPLGDVVGTLTTDRYIQESTGTLRVQVGVSGSDHVTATGTRSTVFDGAVEVTRLGGVTPAPGSSLDVVGAANATLAPTLGSSLSTTDDLASQHYGLAHASGKDVVVTRAGTVVLPRGSVTPNTARRVITTGGAFTATCRFNLAPVKRCAVLARSSTGTVLASGPAVLAPSGAAALTVTLTLTPAGIAAAGAFGGATVKLTATITPTSGAVVTATNSLVVVKKLTRRTILASALFAGATSTLTTAGRSTLTAVARAAARSLVLECDGHTIKTAHPAADAALGLKRATAVCSFVKATVVQLNLTQVKSYVVKTFGGTKPVSLSVPAKNARIELLLTN